MATLLWTTPQRWDGERNSQLRAGILIDVGQQTPVRNSDHIAVESCSGLASGHGSVVRPAAACPGSSFRGLRDCALIAFMIYTFARVGTVLKVRTGDVFIQGRRTCVRLHEKGGKRHEIPCQHKLES